MECVIGTLFIPHWSSFQNCCLGDSNDLETFEFLALGAMSPVAMATTPLSDHALPPAWSHDQHLSQNAVDHVESMESGCLDDRGKDDQNCEASGCHGNIADESDAFEHVNDEVRPLAQHENDHSAVSDDQIKDITSDIENSIQAVDIHQDAHLDHQEDDQNDAGDIDADKDDDYANEGEYLSDMDFQHVFEEKDDENLKVDAQIEDKSMHNDDETEIVASETDQNNKDGENLGNEDEGFHHLLEEKDDDHLKDDAQTEDEAMIQNEEETDIVSPETKQEDEQVLSMINDDSVDRCHDELDASDSEEGIV